MSTGCCIENSFVFWIIGLMRKRELNVLPYISLWKNKAPLVGLFLGGFFFMCKLYKPCPKDAVCQISEYLDCQFMRRRSSNIHHSPNITPFCPLLGPNMCHFANLNPHSPKIYYFIPNLVEIG